MSNKIYLLLLAIFLLACSDRERLNPLDPDNPNTHGSVTGTRVVSNRDTVRLSWNPMNVNNMLRYEIYRGNVPDGMSYYSDTNAETDFFSESGLSFDVKYYYVVKAVTEFSTSRPSDTVAVIPGPANIFVADHFGYYLYEISYDGSSVIRFLELSSPTALEYDSVYQILWVADFWDRSIIAINRDFSINRYFRTNSSPIDLALDEVNERIFVLQINDSLQGFYYDGEEIFTGGFGTELSFHSGLVFNDRDHYLWVSPRQDDILFRVSVDDPFENIMTIEGIKNPDAIAADALNGGVWVASDSGLVKVETDGTLTFFLDGYHILDLSVDENSGDCYYTAVHNGSGNWETGRLEYANQEKHIILGREYDYLYNIFVIPGSTDTGIIVQQESTGKLLRFDSAGEQISELSGFSYKLDFAAD